MCHHYDCQPKGRIGKTTTAINLSAAIANRDKRTLLIDLDPQANSTIAFLLLAKFPRPCSTC